jgi:hypothetical protein
VRWLRFVGLDDGSAAVALEDALRDDVLLADSLNGELLTLNTARHYPMRPDRPATPVLLSRVLPTASRSAALGKPLLRRQLRATLRPDAYTGSGCGGGAGGCGSLGSGYGNGGSGAGIGGSIGGSGSVARGRPEIVGSLGTVGYFPAMHRPTPDPSVFPDGTMLAEIAAGLGVTIREVRQCLRPHPSHFGSYAQPVRRSSPSTRDGSMGPSAARSGRWSEAWRKSLGGLDVVLVMAEEAASRRRRNAGW